LRTEAIGLCERNKGFRRLEIPCKVSDEEKQSSEVCCGNDSGLQTGKFGDYRNKSSTKGGDQLRVNSFMRVLCLFTAVEIRKRHAVNFLKLAAPSMKNG
jgi:hypothetical protein